MSSLDDAAVAALRDLYSDLQIDGRVLDLCGTSAGHFEFPPDELVACESDPEATLPYEDEAFDDVICAGGVGALSRPLETFAEVARVLRRGGHFVCTFVGGDAGPPDWSGTDDAGRVRIVRRYFQRTDAFGPAESDLRTSLTGAGDRLWAVWAAKR